MDRSVIFRFGTFELDTVLGVLRHDGLRVRLSDKPFQLLNLLVEHQGKIVSRDEVRQRLWGAETFVDFEGNVSVTLAKLRQVLSDSPDRPLFIETIPRRGYRFIAPVTSLAESTASVVSDSEPELPSTEHPARAAPTVAVLARRPAWILASLVCVAVIVGGLLYFGWLRLFAPAAGASHKISILVVPFENLSGDHGQDYLSDGLTEEMITQVGQSSPAGLSVIAPSTAMQYKGTHRTLEQLGREQSVDYILEGSLRRQGERVRITAQLFKVHGQSSLWAETYERETQDLLSVQREVANKIVQSLSLEVLPPPRNSLWASRSVNAEAYDNYLRGLFEINKRTQEGLERGIRYFRAATNEDPGFAQAYVGLAYSYETAASWTFLRPRDAYPNAKLATQKALAIGGGLADAHVVSGEALHEYDWDWSGAEQEYRRALELNPSSALGHKLYAEYLTHAGRYSDALREIRTAQQLDPLSMITNSLVCYVQVHAHQFGDAVSECSKVIKLDPSFGPAHYFLGEAYSGRHQYAEAVSEHQEALRLSGNVSMMSAAIAANYAASGRNEDARRILNELLARSKNTYVSPYALGKVYVALGDAEAAFVMLEKAFEERSFELLYLADDPFFESLHNDGRFKQMIVKRGFPITVHVAQSP